MGIRFQQLEKGLEYAHPKAPIAAGKGDGHFHVLRVDPAHFDFRLLLASEHEKRRRSVPQWAQEFGQVAAINAGMYNTDDKISGRGYVRNGRHRNNDRYKGDRALMVFNPRDTGLPEFQILDKSCDSWAIAQHYRCVVESSRMIHCRGASTWSSAGPFWSMGMVATDAQGRVLLIFTKSLFRAKDFARVLAESPLGLNNMLYMDGAPPAAFALFHTRKRLMEVGDYSWNPKKSPKPVSRVNERFVQVPIVLGIERPYGAIYGRKRTVSSLPRNT